MAAENRDNKETREFREREYRDYYVTSPAAGSVFNFLAGIWLIISPFILGYSRLTVARQNDIFVGVLILIFGFLGVIAPRLSLSRWINIALGIWLILSPFILGFSLAVNAVWNNVILGIIIVMLGTWGLSAVRQREHRI